MSRSARLLIGIFVAGLAGCQKQHKEADGEPRGSVSAIPEVTPSASPSASPLPSPDPATLRPIMVEYRSISHAQTCRGNTRTRIESDGRVFTATNQADCTGGSPWSTPYPAQPVRTLSAPELDALARSVLGSGFFDLPPRYSEPGRNTMDGRDEEIEVTVGERKHQAVMERNSSQPAFTTVRQAIVDAAFVP